MLRDVTRIAAGLGFVGMSILAQAAQAPHPLDGIPGVVAKGAVVELVKEGFTFIEGPVPAADGGLFFSDIPADRIYRLDPGGTVSLYRERTNGANGLAVAANGDLLAVEARGRRVSRTGADHRIVVVTEGTADRPLLEPNDLILDAKGGIYFTDPGPSPVVPGRTVYVYYLPPGARQPVVLDDTIVRPNGIILARDGKTLMVNDSLGDTVFAYDVRSDGTVTNKRPFAKLLGMTPGQDGGADGMAVDRNDRLYVTTATGVQVFDRTGTHLGTIAVPRPPSNVAFAGPGRRTLYITARQGLYRLTMLSQGPDRPGK